MPAAMVDPTVSALTRRGTLCWTLVVALGFAVACRRGEGPAAAGEPPASVLLVTLDTTRADRLGAYGHRAAVTPTLDRLASEGVLFESAIAPAPSTLPSHTSLLTGVYPSAHGVRDNLMFALDPEATLISEVLSRHGWRTGAFVGSFVLDARFGLDQGFEVYRGPSLREMGKGLPVERPANEVVDDAIAWLETVQPGERFFAWVHFYDPHLPYLPPEEIRDRVEDPYDGEIAFCDAELGRLLSHLERRGLDEALLTVVVADHGESFGEHGEKTHGVFLYQSTLHVPLVFSGPPVAHSRGKRVEEVVSITSVTTTLLEWIGLPREEMPDIRIPSLLSSGELRPPADPVVYVESYTPYHSHRWRALRGLLWRNHKLIEGHRMELYDLSRDPEELRDLAHRHAPLVEEMTRRLEGLVAKHGLLNVAGEHVDVDAGEAELLGALGYVIGVTGGDPLDPSLPDAAERIGDISLCARARGLSARYNELMRQPPAATAWQNEQRQAEAKDLLRSAKRLLDQVTAANPRDLEAIQLLGSVELGLENYAAAIPLLERAARSQPRSSLVQANLVIAYKRAGRAEDAIRQAEAAVALAPSPTLYRWLASHHTAAGEFGRAAWWLSELSRHTEEGSAEQREVRRWLEDVRGEMRKRGQELDPPERRAHH